MLLLLLLLYLYVSLTAIAQHGINFKITSISLGCYSLLIKFCKVI